MIEWSRVARRIRVPLGFAFTILYFWLAQPTSKFLAIGVSVVIPGLLMRALASGHVRKNEALATSGPYAYTRNPLYLGSILIAVGFALAARSWWIGVALLLMFLVIYVPVIRDEETFLRAKFPEFDQYARQVPRMIPRITPAPSGDSGQFSMELYLKHREWNALLGSVAMLVGLVAKLYLMPS